MWLRIKFNCFNLDNIVNLYINRSTDGKFVLIGNGDGVKMYLYSHAEVEKVESIFEKITLAIRARADYLDVSDH